MKHGDIVFGTVGTAGTFTLAQFNTLLGCAAGILTVAVMVFKLRREWIDRNK